MAVGVIHCFPFRLMRYIVPTRWVVCEADEPQDRGVETEGVIEHGQVRLNTRTPLPEGARVYMIVPAISTEPAARIVSPRLVHPEQIDDFATKVTEDSSFADFQSTF